MKHTYKLCGVFYDQIPLRETSISTMYLLSGTAHPASWGITFDFAEKRKRFPLFQKEGQVEGV